MTTKLATTTTHTAKITHGSEGGTTVLSAAVTPDGSLSLEMASGSRLLDMRLDRVTARAWASWITQHVPQSVGSGDHD